MTAWGLAVATAVILFAGPGLPLLAKRVSRIYALYFCFAFILRSVLLVTLEPSPSSGSAFAVADLAAGGYDRSVPLVLPYASASGLGLFAALWLVTRLPLSRRVVELTLPVPYAVVIYATGCALRLAAAAAPDSGLFARLGSLGQTACLVVLAGIVLGTNWRNSSQRLVLCLAGAEVAFSVLSASKTPLLTVLLLVYLDPRWWSRSRASRVSSRQEALSRLGTSRRGRSSRWRDGSTASSRWPASGGRDLGCTTRKAAWRRRCCGPCCRDGSRWETRS